jgi:D-cysteine desulfhydrase
MNRLSLALRPTPLFRHAELDRIVGTRVWVKRDDMTGSADSGNKLRKLEYLFAEALEQGAKGVITCGGAQSNHARATALSARRLGLDATLFLRTANPSERVPSVGNVLLDRLAGAEIRWITPAQYANRSALMQGAAAELGARGRPSYVIPEGGSNGLGSLGYVDAMREVREQLDRGEADKLERFDIVVVACGSGGTAAGTALGVELHGVAQHVLAVAVCDDSAYFERVIRQIVKEATDKLGIAVPPRTAAGRSYRVDDRHIGPGYAVASAEQKQFIADVARHTGLILDPVYTGKALFGLAAQESKPETALFVHTGGLPGLLAQAAEFETLLGA